MNRQPWSQEELSLLKQLAPFSHLPEPLRQETLDSWQRRSASPGDLLLKKGQTKHKFLFVVLSGMVRLIGGAVNRASEGAPPGMLFGIPNLLQGGPSPYEALVSLPTVYARLPAAQFHPLLDENEAFASAFQQDVEPLAEQPDAGGWVGGVEASPFAFFQNWHGSQPWGSVLDAGTGESSLRWIMGLPTERWVAVTGDPLWTQALQTLFGAEFREQDQLIEHNWLDGSLLQDETFDIVVADYLLGAIERFAPYFQVQLWSRLRPHVGKYLYIVGLEPTELSEANTVGGQMIQTINRLRDSLLVMAGRSGFREYPLSWVRHTLEQSGFVVEAVQTFPNRLGSRYIDTVLDDCIRLLPDLQAPELANAMAKHIENLRQQAMELHEAAWGIRFSQDYAVVARPV